jgi:hypothetical protein
MHRAIYEFWTQRTQSTVATDARIDAMLLEGSENLIERRNLTAKVTHPYSVAIKSPGISSFLL